MLRRRPARNLRGPAATRRAGARACSGHDHRPGSACLCCRGAPAGAHGTRPRAARMAAPRPRRPQSCRPAHPGRGRGVRRGARTVSAHAAADRSADGASRGAGHVVLDADHRPETRPQRGRGRPGRRPALGGRRPDLVEPGRRDRGRPDHRPAAAARRAPAGVPISAMPVLGVSGRGRRRLTGRRDAGRCGRRGADQRPAAAPAAQPRRGRGGGTGGGRGGGRAGASGDRPAGRSLLQQALGWLEDFRRLDRSVERAAAAVTEAADSRRFNPRAVGTADTDRRCGAGSTPWSTASSPFARCSARSPTGSQRRSGRTRATPRSCWRRSPLLLRDLADSFRAFGALVRSESDTLLPGAEAPLARAMDALGETRARLTELLLVDTREDPNR